MAAEALDIKTLTTLVMATPKTDIEQAVGRIMRDRYSSPLIVDIVDQHGIFLNQWKKRKTFYKSNKYNISEIQDMHGEPTEPIERDFVGFGKCLIATKMP
jgi:hypothetical protein